VGGVEFGMRTSMALPTGRLGVDIY